MGEMLLPLDLTQTGGPRQMSSGVLSLTLMLLGLGYTVGTKCIVVGWLHGG